MLVLYVKKLILSVYRQKSVARSFCYWMPVLFQRRPIETKRSVPQKKIDRTMSTSITTHCDILQSTGTVVLSKLERFRLRLVTEVMITKRQPRFSDTSGLLRSILFSCTIIGSSMAIERSPAPSVPLQRYWSRRTAMWSLVWTVHARAWFYYQVKPWQCCSRMCYRRTFVTNKGSHVPTLCHPSVCLLTNSD